MIATSAAPATPPNTAASPIPPQPQPIIRKLTSYLLDANVGRNERIKDCLRNQLDYISLASVTAEPLIKVLASRNTVVPLSAEILPLSKTPCGDLCSYRSPIADKDNCSTIQKGKLPHVWVHAFPVKWDVSDGGVCSVKVRH